VEVFDRELTGQPMKESPSAEVDAGMVPTPRKQPHQQEITAPNPVDARPLEHVDHPPLHAPGIASEPLERVRIGEGNVDGLVAVDPADHPRAVQPGLVAPKVLPRDLEHPLGRQFDRGRRSGEVDDHLRFGLRLVCRSFRILALICAVVAFFSAARCSLFTAAAHA